MNDLRQSKSVCLQTTSDSPTEVRLLTYDEVRAEYLELEQEDDIIAIIPVIAGPLPPDDGETATGEQQSEATNGNTGEVNENLNSEQQVNQSNANNNTQAPTGENRIIWSVSVRDFEESDILYVGPQYVPHAQLEVRTQCLDSQFIYCIDLIYFSLQLLLGN